MGVVRGVCWEARDPTAAAELERVIRRAGRGCWFVLFFVVRVGRRVRSKARGSVMACPSGYILLIPAIRLG